MKRNTIKFFVIYILAILVVLPVHAQEAQTLSVTPPLFQISVLPGDSWQSTVKVVNSNKFPLTIYTEVVNFVAEGEYGQGQFVPVDRNDNERSTLAEWVTISGGPYVIEPERALDVPFLLEVPKDAPPGGHYAAVLITTEPPQEGDSALAVRTAQSVASLFFLRVEGDVEEQGSIREFAPTKSLLSTPDVALSLRFENKGNVHLQPRGNIIITNMWGTERGVIPINQQTHFGNVLPKSIRDFAFAWKSDFRITDIGRYKAEAVITYGQNGMKSDDAVTHFWVIPIKGTLITLSILAVFITLIVLMVKAYVRRMLALAGVDVHRTESEDQVKTREERVRKTYRVVSAPLKSGVLDLRNRIATAEDKEGFFKVLGRFVVNYKWFFISVVILLGIVTTIVLYITKATEERKDYQVIIGEGENKKVLHGSELPSLGAE